MIRLFTGFIPARGIYVAAKLGLADALAKGARSPAELAGEVGADAGALKRLMRLLAGIGIFHEDDHGAFALTPLGETLRSDSPDSVRRYAMLYHEIQYPSLMHLDDAVTTGVPQFERTFGASVFAHLQADAERAQTFQAGLGERSRIDCGALLDAYDFSSARRIVDVGGGNGALLSAILARHPDVQGVLYDLAPAIAAARAGRGGPLPRTELAEGDFFKSVPAGADHYLLKLVLHDWSDDECVTILTNCRKAMAPGGRVLILEGLIGAPNSLSFTHAMDLVMLCSFTGAERTEQEFKALLARAGLTLTRIVPTASELNVIEAMAE